MRSSNFFLSPVFLTGLLALLLSGQADAIDPNRALSQFTREHWGIEQGFPGGPVNSLAQAEGGYLAIGAEAGLISFDGSAFTFIRNQDPLGFDIDHILGLISDREGNLWLRLNDPSALRLRQGTFSAVWAGFGWDPRATAITAASDGGLLFATALNGILHFDGSKFATVVSQSDVPRSPVISIAQTADGDIWLGTREQGVFHIRQGSKLEIVKGLSDPKINCLLPGGNGELWIGTDHGIAHWNGHEISMDGLPSSLRREPILALLRDSDSNIWIGTATQGLLRLNSRGFSALDVHQSVTAIFEDREGNIWFGSDDGLDRLSESALVTFSARQGLPAENNGPIYADSDGRIWWAPATGGLHWLYKDQVGSVSVADLENDVIYSITGGDGLWIGRQRGGLTHLLPVNGVFRSSTYTKKEGLAQDSVYSVYRSRDGSVWAGTLTGGVSRLHDGKFQNYNSSNGLAADTITSIVETSDGTMWFATPGGLSAFSGARWQTYGSQDGLPSSNVNCLFEDSAGVLWLGTLHGLAALRSGHIFVPPSLPAFLGEQIFGIAEDHNGSLWVATPNHVLRVNRDRLLQGTLADGDLRAFGIKDGLPGAGGVKRSRSVIASPSGEIWISMVRGISVSDPSRARGQSVPTIVHITSLSVDDHRIDLHSPIRLPGNSKRIAIGYSGLILSAPDRVRFRFTLDGFTGGWSAPLAGSEAVYTNLAPGKYRFHVTASNAGGAWNGNEAAISFVVEPQLWQTWWFRCTALLLSGLLFFTLYRLRLSRLTRQMNLGFEERLAERNRIARDLHDTFLQTIQGTKMVADNALDEDSPAYDDPHHLRKALTQVSVWLEQATREGRATLNSLREAAPSSSGLAEELQQAAQECLIGSPMEISFFIEGTVVELHPVVRDEVYRIGFEAIRNACKHSGGARLEVELAYSRNFALRVRDDGRGVDPDVAANGRDGHFGLKGMQERAARVRGKFNIFTSPKSGTEIELIVPGGVAFSGK